MMQKSVYLCEDHQADWPRHFSRAPHAWWVRFWRGGVHTPLGTLRETHVLKWWDPLGAGRIEATSYFAIRLYVLSVISSICVHRTCLTGLLGALPANPVHSARRGLETQIRALKTAHSRVQQASDPKTATKIDW